MGKSVSLDVEFDGDPEHLATMIRMGTAFRYNGRPLPIRDVIVQGNRLIAVFAHRPLIVDLTDAITALKTSPMVRIQMDFES